MDKRVIQTLKATAEIYGRQLSDTAAAMLLSDLERFSADQILTALSRCRLEIKTFPTVADVIARIDDGRPGVEEAWAMIPKNEDASIVWTDEMAQAFDVARKMIDEDPIAARMAFKETYLKLLGAARTNGTKARWTASLGFEKSGRQAALMEAVEKGRLTLTDALKVCPEIEGPSTRQMFLQHGINLNNLLPEMPK